MSREPSEEVKLSHTPGPWIAFEQADSTAYIVATEAKDQFGRRAEDIVRVPLFSFRSQANAQLLAAAPDLLAACKLAFDDLKGQSTTSVPTIKALSAAIAKAETGKL